VAVLPFTGHEGVRRGAGEWFAHKLEMNAHYRVIAPGAVEAQLGADAPEELRIDAAEARRRGGLLGARVAVIGHIKSQDTAEIEITLVDVSTGELVQHTSSRRTAEAWITGLYPTTVAAVEEVAQMTLVEIKARGARRGSATETKR